MKKLLIALCLVLAIVTGAKAEFFSDVILTGTQGIWVDARSYSSLNAAVTAIGANDRELVIVSPQIVTSLTIPSNIRLKFIRNGSITNSGQLTINTKNIEAENRQIFTGVGNIDFAAGTILKTAWFSNIETAFALTGNDTVTLIVSKPQTITASYSPGNNVTLRWEAASNILTANAGVTVSNIGQIEAGNYQLFAGAGNFRFRDGTRLNLSWFAHLRSALTYISTNKVTLIVPGTNVVDYNDTIPSTLLLDMDSQQGQFSISGGVTLSFSNYIKPISAHWFGDLTQTTITTALASLGTTNKAILELCPGSWVISSNADWSAYKNVTFKIVPGAVLQIATGTTTTISGPLKAGLHQMFSGDGSVALGVDIGAACPEWWGASGDRITNDYAALTKMFTAVAKLGTVKLSGLYSIDTPLVLSKAVSIIGQGSSTGFYLTMGIASDGIQYGTVEALGLGSSLFYSTWENFGIYGVANACKNALVLKGLINCKFRNIHVMAGTAATGYGVWAMKLQSCHELNFIMSQFYQEYPFPVVGPTNGFKGTSSADAETTIIDCNLALNTEGKSIAIYIWGLNASSITGLSEGNDVNSLYLKGGGYNHIHNFYIEAGTDNPKVKIEDSHYNHIGPGVFFGGGADTSIGLVNANNNVIDGVVVSIINIDSNCINTRIGHVATTGQTSSRLIDNGKNTIQTVVGLGVYQNRGAIGMLSDFSSIIENGSCDRWDGVNTLAGVSWINYSTVTRETTIVQEGKSSVKVNAVGGASGGVAIPIPDILLTRVPYGRITFTGWVYIPTAAGQDVNFSVYLNGGAIVLNGPDPVTTRDIWTKVSFNLDINYEQAYTSMKIMIYTGVAGTFYLDGWSVVPGAAGGSTFFTPNANEFPIYTGKGVWNPGNLVAGAQEAKDFTVLGAELGMIASAGAGIDVVDLIVSATVTAQNIVTVVILNHTAGAVDLASSEWKVMAR